MAGMLALTRKAGERIIVTLEDGRRIEIMLIGTYHNGGLRNSEKARIGVLAPDTVRIMRDELLENTNSAEGAADSGS